MKATIATLLSLLGLAACGAPAPPPIDGDTVVNSSGSNVDPMPAPAASGKTPVVDSGTPIVPVKDPAAANDAAPEAAPVADPPAPEAGAEAEAPVMEAAAPPAADASPDVVAEATVDAGIDVDPPSPDAGVAETGTDAACAWYEGTNPVPFDTAPCGPSGTALNAYTCVLRRGSAEYLCAVAPVEDPACTNLGFVCR